MHGRKAVLGFGMARDEIGELTRGELKKVRLHKDVGTHRFYNKIQCRYFQ